MSTPAGADTHDVAPQRGTAAGLSPADQSRLTALNSMKRLATGLLLLMAVVFAVSFALQDTYPWLAYVRAAAEGGMVGAIADWFAVTALFRYPLGIKIPHTNIIASRKDEIGASLGEFIETNFLSEEVVRGKLESIGIAARVGDWLSIPENAQRVTNELAVAGTGILDVLADDDIKDLIETIARVHLVEPEWGPAIGRVGERLVDSGQQHAAVDLLLQKAEGWLVTHPEAFGRAVSTRLPSWIPGFVDKLVDDRAFKEVLAFVRAVQNDDAHPLRSAIDRYLEDLMRDLQHDSSTIARAEALKTGLLESERLREFASEAWESVKASMRVGLADPSSALRTGIRSTLIDVGLKLSTDAALGARINSWIADSVGYAVQQYRHELAGVITETVERWDAKETTQKIELMVGKDLQFIRLNGTIVGSLAGLAIYSIAQAISALVS